MGPRSAPGLDELKKHDENFSDEKTIDHMKHINLTRNSDLIVVCPASANIIAKLANGYADDLASTTLAAANKKIFVVPAMNKKMWENPANKKNINELKINPYAKELIQHLKFKIWFPYQITLAKFCGKKKTYLK